MFYLFVTCKTHNLFRSGTSDDARVCCAAKYTLVIADTTAASLLDIAAACTFVIDVLRLEDCGASL
ncbi:hypothetical protein DPMN_008063 [Dreissena polymorpha]|uniref:Uncharacterized protein n=1 Tax=Dreissena polymorpha TaxID=45954 RepID=A0A9D4MVF1_DREPO|nr:hypothetical protein DPMN_008063 [Dreissena polymorpha]